MDKYLYGASIQGIQSFIFQTNKLREIVGGSELVEEICTELFPKIFKDLGLKYEESSLILGAAGNIKYEFPDKTSCMAVVRTFPKRVMEMAPGITVSQAVVKLADFKADMQTLEDKLKIQRNKSDYVLGQIGPFMLAETARRTGGSGADYKNDEVLDHSQIAKLNKVDSAQSRLLKNLTGNDDLRQHDLPLDIKDIDPLASNSRWIAVVHADGNNLGLKIMEIYKSLSAEKIKEVIKAFSKVLNEATIAAAKDAYDQVVAPEVDKNSKLPIRPILIGGDDLTVIIRGDLAMEFTEAFLVAFEKQTQDRFRILEQTYQVEELGLGKGLTACAGIAYIKPNYPFHYGADLSETLCGEAKKASKKIDPNFSPSSIYFHKVQSSYIGSFDSIKKGELTAQENLRFDYGPYFIKKQEEYATIAQLNKWVEDANLKNSPKASIREWLGVVRNDAAHASFLLDRIIEKSKAEKFDQKLSIKTFRKSMSKEIDSNENKKEDQVKENEKFTHLYDVISLPGI